MTHFSSFDFKLVGNLITLNCDINGLNRTFIVDSGAPKVILNSRYQDSYENYNDSALKGSTGTISDVGKTKIKSLKCGIIEKHDIGALVMDLSQIEGAIKNEIYGLVGYEFFSEYNVYLDYQNLKLGFWSDGEFEEYIKGNTQRCYNFQMEGHLPIIECKIGSSSYRMALDTGANTNLFDAKLQNLLKKNMNDEEDKKNIVGANIGLNKSNYMSGKMKNMEIEGLGEFSDMDTVFADVSHLNQNAAVEIQGILGFQLFKQRQVVISFTKRKLYVLG